MLSKGMYIASLKHHYIFKGTWLRVLNSIMYNSRSYVDLVYNSWFCFCHEVDWWTIHCTLHVT